MEEGLVVHAVMILMKIMTSHGWLNATIYLVQPFQSLKSGDKETRSRRRFGTCKQARDQTRVWT